MADHPNKELIAEAELRALQFIVGTLLATITKNSSKPTLKELRESVITSIKSANLDGMPEASRELYVTAMLGAVRNVFSAAQGE